MSAIVVACGVFVVAVMWARGIERADARKRAALTPVAPSLPLARVRRD